MTTLTEQEVFAAPMEFQHQSMVAKRRRRLLRNIYQPQDDRTRRETDTLKTISREQLARMTLVLRDYSSRSEGEMVESMVTDVLDASLSISQWTSGTMAEPIFTSSLLFGRETEVQEMVQALMTETEDDVTELWNTMIDDEDWFRVVRLGPTKEDEFFVPLSARFPVSRSDDDLIHFRRHVVIEKPEYWDRCLYSRAQDDLDRTWPLVLKYSNPKKRIPDQAVGFIRRSSREEFESWQAD